jgi:O-antigen/teichoic acid export membrane protein
MKELYCATSRWMFLLNFPVVLLTVLFATPILALFGESFTTGTTALILLSLATLANICTGLAGTIIDMTGYTKLKLVNSVAQLSLFVVTSVLFIPTWGVIGAAAAAMLSGSIIQIARLVQVSYLFKMHPYDSWFARAAAAALLTTLLGFLTRWYFGTDANIIYAALHSLLLMGVYGGALLLIGLAPHDQLLAWRMVGRVRSLLFKQKGPAKAFAGSAE